MKKEVRNPWLLFFILLLLSFALRLIKINQGLWFDEIFSLIHYVRADWIKILTDLSNPNNHILINLLAKLSRLTFGEREWSLRLPSLLLGGISPPLLYLLARNQLGESVSFSASLFLALSYWQVWFSQDMRGYAGMIFCSILSQFLYLDWREHPRFKLALAYLLFSSLGCYFHIYMTFLLSAQILDGFLTWAFKPKERRAGIFWLPLLSLFFVFLLYLPGLKALINWAEEMGHDVGERWLNWYFLQDLLNLFASSPFLVIQFILTSFFFVGLVPLFRRQPVLARIYCSAFCLELLLTWVRHYLIYARYEAFFMPFFFLGIAASLDYIRLALGKKAFPPRLGFWVNSALTGILCVLLSLGLFRYYDLGKQGYKQAAKYLERNYPDAEVVSLGVIGRTFLYYCPQAELVSGKEPFNPSVVRGKMLVASFPKSWKTWHPQNRQIIRNLCRVEKVWESAGYEDNAVYLFNCLEKEAIRGAPP